MLPDTKERFRQAALKRWRDPIFRARITSLLSGKKRTLQTIEKLRQNHLGRKFTEEIRQKIRQAHLTPEALEVSRNINLGRTHSEESKEKNRQINLGRKMPLEFAAKCGKQCVGLRISDERKARIGRANKGRQKSQEVKDLISIQHCGRKRTEEQKLHRKYYIESHPEYGQKISIAVRKLNHRGPRSTNWKGGVTPLQNKIRESREMRSRVQKVLNRDHHICQRCTAHKATAAHHINSLAHCYMNMGLQL